MSGFSDPRISYINPGRRLSMSENWEYALGHVADADYVTVLGDDDGLIPRAIEDLVRLIGKYPAGIVTWKKIEYCWPNHPDSRLRHYLSIPLSNRLVRIPSRMALRLMYRFWMPYAHGPCIYNSLVSWPLVAGILCRDGKLFQSVCPDVYSSLALASVSDSYLFSSRPFTINGASAHSNGTASMRPDVSQKATELFFSEYASGGERFSDVRGSYTAAVMESLVAFSLHAKVKSPGLPFRAAFTRILAELGACPGGVEANTRALMVLAQRHGYGALVGRRIQRVTENAGNPGQTGTTPGLPCLPGNVTLWGDRFSIEDVYGACLHSGSILGDYAAPSAVVSYSIASAIFTKLIARGYGMNQYLAM